MPGSSLICVQNRCVQCPCDVINSKAAWFSQHFSHGTTVFESRATNARETWAQHSTRPIDSPASCRDLRHMLSSSLMKKRAEGRRALHQDEVILSPPPGSEVCWITRYHVTGHTEHAADKYGCCSSSEWLISFCSCTQFSYLWMNSSWLT